MLGIHIRIRIRVGNYKNRDQGWDTRIGIRVGIYKNIRIYKNRDIGDLCDLVIGPKKPEALVATMLLSNLLQ